MKADSIRTIFQGLGNADVKFLLVGGLAVNSHGYVRATRDVDLVLLLEESNLERAFSVLKEIGYHPAVPISAKEFADPAKRETWRVEKNMIVLKMWSEAHRETPIDIFLEEPFDFPLEYSRARLESYEDGFRIPVVALGTLLEMKEAAGRPQDLADLEALKQLHNLK